MTIHRSRWLLAALASVGFHAVAIGSLLTNQPASYKFPVVQTIPKLDMSAYAVRKENSSEVEPDQKLADEQRISGQQRANQVIKSVIAVAQVPKSNSASLIQFVAPQSAGEEAIGDEAAPILEPHSIPLSSILPSAPTSFDAELPNDRTTTLTAPTSTATVLSLTDHVEVAIALSQETVLPFARGQTSDTVPFLTNVEASEPIAQALSDQNVQVGSSQPDRARLEPVTKSAVLVNAEKVSTGATSNGVEPQSFSASAITTQETSVLAADQKAETISEAKLVHASTDLTVAWAGAPSQSFAPSDLSVVQSLLDPDQVTGSKTSRDKLSDELQRFDCARIEAEFLPDIGTLAVRGHVREDADRVPLLDAISATLGGAIKLEDNLRMLGDDSFVAIHDLQEGERLIFEMVGSDFDAYVYVDYFNSAGDVIHFVPSAVIPQLLMPKGATRYVGAADSEMIVIRPPFGTEFAAAFIVSHAIPNWKRPPKEPALSYLADFQTAITELRKAQPDFRGEWVYFFVATGPKT